MDDPRRQVVDLIRSEGYRPLKDPAVLSGGQLSYDYVDGKRAIRRGRWTSLVGEAVTQVVDDLGVEFTTVGGPTMGADAIAVGIAVARDCLWFSVRKEPKKHGLQKWIEGAELGSSDKVLLVDDVVTSGKSIKDAFDLVVETGAQVVAVVAMVDRGDRGSAVFAGTGIPYYALVTYRDLDIAPVNEPRLTGAATG
jgi:orotate phosphoribosyltransferase